MATSSRTRTTKSEPKPGGRRGLVTSRDYPLEESIGFLVGVTNRKLQKVLDSRIAGSGVTSGTWHFMRVLWQEHGMSQAELAKRVNTSAPTVNAALRKLQAAGLVVLDNDPNDGRRWNVHLTKKGQELEEKLLPLLAETNQMLGAGLTRAEVAEFKRMLAILQANAEAALG